MLTLRGGRVWGRGRRAGVVKGGAVGGLEGLESRVLLSAADWVFSTVASFTGSDPGLTGSAPYSVIVDARGNVLGATSANGNFNSGANTNAGAIFKLPANGSTVSNIAYFNPLINGLFVHGKLALDAAGNLYGASTNGGAGGFGALWELAAGSSTVTTLATFTDQTVAWGPLGGVVLDAAGNLFGTSNRGGLNDLGAIWELPAGTRRIINLASFDQNTGTIPVGGLTLDERGALWGTTEQAGPGGYGTLFRLDAGGHTITVIDSFNKNNGAVPASNLVFDRAGNLWGTTTAGGAGGHGAVWKLPVGSSTIQLAASFDVTADGAAPQGALILDGQGNLFGVTAGGGAFNYGTVWELPAGSSTLVNLHNFDNTDGSGANGGLAMDAHGNLFGTTTFGGASNWGVLFELSPVVGRSLFDETYYLRQNPDVAAAVSAGLFNSGFQHFLRYGQHEGRAPSAFYNEQFYLAHNPDVAAAVTAGTFASGFEHFALYGQREGRQPSAYFSESYYLQAYPDVAAAVAARTFQSGFEHYMLFGQRENRNPLPYFNSQYTLATNSEIAALVHAHTYESAIDAYLNAPLSSHPSPLDLFDEAYYLQQNPDVTVAVLAHAFISGWDHFVKYGFRETRVFSTGFNEADYRARNADVAAAVAAGEFTCGLEHYILYGRAEGRVI